MILWMQTRYIEDEIPIRGLDVSKYGDYVKKWRRNNADYVKNTGKSCRDYVKCVYLQKNKTSSRHEQTA